MPIQITKEVVNKLPDSKFLDKAELLLDPELLEGDGSEGRKTALVSLMRETAEHFAESVCEVLPVGGAQVLKAGAAFLSSENDALKKEHAEVGDIIRKFESVKTVITSEEKAVMQDKIVQKMTEFEAKAIQHAAMHIGFEAVSLEFDHIMKNLVNTVFSSKGEK